MSKWNFFFFRNMLNGHDLGSIWEPIPLLCFLKAKNFANHDFSSSYQTQNLDIEISKRTFYLSNGIPNGHILL